MKNCHCHSEINRDGTGQLDRYLQALDPTYAPIDNRSLEELLVFAKRYAEQIRFYDIPESRVENTEESSQITWEEFFRRDMAVIAASIAVTDLKEVKERYDSIREKMELQPNAELFAGLFNLALKLAKQIDGWYSVAIPENPLHQDLHIAIVSTLREQLKKIYAYDEGFKIVNTGSSKVLLNIEYPSLENEEIWGIRDAIDLDTSIYQGNTFEDKIRYAALYAEDVFNSFYGFVNDLKSDSERYLHFALEQYPAHQPHMALYISFLRLFKLVQEQMNGLTGKMLDFYYQDVLRLTPKGSVPDKVHIIFELAQDITEYNLSQGTALTGGKDISGIEQVYKTTNSLVLNQAKVKELKTIFIQHSPDREIIEAIYARPIANSKDGFGEKFTEPNPKWRTFGHGEPKLSAFNNICNQISQINEEVNRKDQTKVGFAIASPQLVLQGGNRLITCRIPRIGEVVKEPEIWLSAEDGWLKISKSDGSLKDIYNKESGVFNDSSSFDRSSFFVLDYSDSSLIHIFLSIAEKPIVSFNPKIHEGNYHTSYPVMQIMVGPEIDLAIEAYRDEEFHEIALSVYVGSTNLYNDKDDHKILSFDEPNIFVSGDVHLDGLKNITIQNQDGLVSSNKPFDPFTAYPQQGSSFYLGSDEIFNKPIKELTVNALLMSDPTSGFSDSIRSLILEKDKRRILKVRILENRMWISLSRKSGADFDFNTLTQNILYKQDKEGSSREIRVGRLPLTYNTEYVSGTTYKGFIQIENDIALQNLSDFTFPELQRELAQYLKIKEISISYRSELINLDPTIDQLFHVYPFGVAEIYPGTPYQESDRNNLRKHDQEKNQLLIDAKNHLLPQFTYLSPYKQLTTPRHVVKRLGNAALFNAGVSGKQSEKVTGQLQNIPSEPRVLNLLSRAAGMEGTIAEVANQYAADTQEEGMLFIGIEHLNPLQSITLLFQFAEGSAEDEDNDSPSIHWSYLTNNEWRPMKGEYLVSDGTYGFQTTGIIKIDVPADATNNNTIITEGLVWFCASVTENSNRIPQLIDVVAQAVEAVFEDQGNAPAHFDQALPAGNISKLAAPVAEISKIQQPFASFDGKHPEIGKAFYTRVSERLRHKGRAITAWDHEHLVLERFPDIYKVKTIPHTDPDCLCRQPDETDEVTITEHACCGSQLAPGHVLILPIANLKNRNAVNPLQPKTSRRTLLAIEDYLKERVSPFVKVHAKNPIYEQILVSFKVKFYTGTDKGFYMKKLNEEIVHFLTPWAFDEKAEVTFGQKVYASAIINFIEKRPYVDFITDFTMVVCCNECCTPEVASQEVKITVKVVNEEGSGIPGVTLKINNSNLPFIYDENTKEYTLEGKVTNYFTIEVSKDEYKTEESHYLKPSDAKQNITLDFIIINSLTKSRETMDEKLSGISNCDDMECFLEGNATFKREIVAKPCTSRSLLVSAPQHEIIPYEEPPYVSPCETRKETKEIKSASGLSKKKSPPPSPEAFQEKGPVPTPAKKPGAKRKSKPKKKGSAVTQALEKTSKAIPKESAATSGEPPEAPSPKAKKPESGAEKPAEDKNEKP